MTKEKSMNVDLTVGKPASVLWKFCLPLLGSVIFQQLYNLADSLVAGLFIGENALAAVGNSYEITLIFLAFAFGCNIGCSVIVSRLFGAKNYTDLKTAVYTTLISSAVLCVVLMVVGLTCSKLILKVINTPDEILADSVLYLDIYVWGLPFVLLYNIATGIFSALGDSKTPFIFLAASSTANIGMDVLFVTVFKMGVAGVAWATFICQGISCILAMVFVFLRLAKIKAEEKPKPFSGRIFKDIVVIAIPSILQQSSISFGNIIIQSIVNSFGTGVIAGYSAAIKLNNIAISSFATMSNGISNYSSQNLGAEKIDRIKQGFWAGLKMFLIIAVPLVLLYSIAGKYLVGIFLTNPSAEASYTGEMFLRIVSPFYIIIAVKLVCDGILRGTSQIIKFMIGTFADLILRVIFAFVLAKYLGSNGIWSGWPIGWTLSTVMSVLFYRFCYLFKNNDKNKNSDSLSDKTDDALDNDAAISDDSAVINNDDTVINADSDSQAEIVGGDNKVTNNGNVVTSDNSTFISNDSKF